MLDALRRAAQHGYMERHSTGPFRALLTLASMATACVGLWLVYVTFAILPAHDPDRIVFWRVAALVLFSYSALSWLYVVKPRVGWLRIVVLAMSAAALFASVHSAWSMVQDDRAGGHVEGYIFLMALVIGGHGACAIAYTVASMRGARDARAAG